LRSSATGDLADHAGAAVSIHRLVAEQLTKTTGDAILLTQQCVDALVSRPSGLTDRGSHALKRKSAAMQVFGLDPTV
jgi:adenylate cyclase